MQTAEAGGFWLDQKHPEFDQIQYYLKTCLQDRGATQNLEVWKIDNPETSYKYERRTANMLKVACWTHSNTIEGCTLEEICTKGVRFDRTDKGGMEFKTGVIEFSSDLALYTSYCLVYFEVAVGRAYIYDGDPVAKNIPAGYDSFYIPPLPLDWNNDGEFDLHEYQTAAQFENRDPTHYRHRYFVKDPTQLCPKYVVRFDLTKKVPGGAIGFSPAGLPKTATEPAEDDELSMFDPISLTAVSRRALHQSGFHGSGASTIMGATSPAGPSSAVPIQQAFNQAMEDFYIKDKDPVMLSKRDWTSRQLTILEEKVREVNLNYAEISEAIAEAAAKAVQRLQTITRSKLETCLSMEIELRRETEQLAWLDAHIDAQMRDAQAAAINTSLPKSEQLRRKLDFIKSWKYYTIFRNSVSRAKPTELQALSSLHGDTKIHADIQIFTDPFYSGSGGGLPHSSAAGMNTHGSTAVGGMNGALAAASESHFSMQPYAVPAQPTEILVSASLQSLVDEEMEAIQRAVRAAVEGEGPPLPRSVERPLVGGDPVPLPLHELLDSIPEEPLSYGDHFGYGYGEDGLLSQDAAFQNALLASADGIGPGLPPNGLPPPPPVADQYEHDGAAQADPSAEDRAASPFPPQGPPPQQPAVYAASAQNGQPQRSSMFALFPSNASVASSQRSVSPALAPTEAAPATNPPGQHANSSAQPRKGSIVRPGALADRNTAAAAGTQQPATRRSVVGPKASKASDGASVLTQDSRASRDAIPANMNLKHQGKVIYMDKQQLLQFASTKEQHSLREIGARKRKQMLAKNALPAGLVEYCGLQDSEVIASGEVENLLFSLPFFTRPPTLRLLYSTSQHYRSLEELLAKAFKHRGPNLLLIKSGEFSFGAYLTHQLSATCAWSGSPSCFLFSNTLALKVPYHARTAAEVAGTALGVPGRHGAITANSPLAFFVQPDAIFIGNGDLSIDGELLSGTSELENFYGCGVVPRSPEALCLLAGTPVFNIDVLELWAVVA